MSNEFFTSSSTPATGAQGSSATIRAEFEQIAAAFDKLPVLAGNAGEIVSINGTGTALEASGVLLANLITLTSSGTITNKTFTWDGNTWTGFGSAATKTAGVSADNVLLLQANNTLPVLDAWNLTNINPAALGVIPVTSGGTGETTLEGAKDALGVNAKVDAVSGVFTGNPIAPTPAPADYSERLATTKYVMDALALVEITAGSLTLGAGLPVMDGIAAAGVAITASHSDHVHPSDTSRASTSDLSSGLAGKQNLDPTLTGLAAMTVGTANLIPVSSGSDAFGTKTFNPNTGLGTSISTIPSESVVKTYVDAADALKAPITSPNLLGTPTCPTNTGVTKNTSTTQIINQAYLEARILTLPGGVAVSNNNPLMNGAVAPGTSADASRADHVHPSDTSRASLVANTFTGQQTLPGGGTGLQAATAGELVSGLAGKQNLDPTLTGLAAMTVGAANLIPVSSGADSFGTKTFNSTITLSNISTSVASDSIVNAYVDATKHTIWMPAIAMTPRTDNGAVAGTVQTTSNKVMLKTLDFIHTADTFAQFAVRMPKSWNESSVTAQFLFSHLGGAISGTVVFGLKAVALSSTDALDVAFGVEQTVSTTLDATTSNDLQQTAVTAAVAISGAAAGDWVVFEVRRDTATDTLLATARLHGIALFYTVDVNTDA